jgi:hypothetical protein
MEIGTGYWNGERNNFSFGRVGHTLGKAQLLEQQQES